MRIASIFLAFLIIAVLSGCSRNGASYGTTGQATPAPGAKTVNVTLSEWHVKLSPSAISPGPVSFNIKNTGTINHSFTVKGNGVNVTAKVLGPGESTTMSADLAAGTYDAYCPIDGHAGRGMRTKLTVK
jgi:uncharacterized cupredoxin-like copper-binding protein